MNTERAAKAWFIGEISEFVHLGPSRLKLWDLALAHRDEADNAEHWQAWVRLCCEGLRDPGVNNPPGLLTHRLTDTSPRDVAVKRVKPVRAISNQTPFEAAQFKARAVAARTERPAPLPSSVAMGKIQMRVGGWCNALSLVTEEWEKQGRPYPEDFDASALGVDSL